MKKHLNFKRALEQLRRLQGTQLPLAPDGQSDGGANYAECIDDIFQDRNDPPIWVLEHLAEHFLCELSFLIALAEEKGELHLELPNGKRLTACSEYTVGARGDFVPVGLLRG